MPDTHDPILQGDPGEPGPAAPPAAPDPAAAPRDFDFALAPPIFHQAFDEAFSLCKRLDTTLLSPAHLFFLLALKVPDLFPATPARPDPAAFAYERLAAAPRDRTRLAVQVSAELAFLLELVRAEGPRTLPEGAKRLVAIARERLPRCVEPYFPDPASGAASSALSGAGAHGAPAGEGIAASSSAAPAPSSPSLAPGQSCPAASAEPSPAPARYPFFERWDAERARAVDFPLAGRRRDLERIAQVLLRRRHRSLFLTGDPGVGRSHLVRALFHLAARGEFGDLGPLSFHALSAPRFLTAVSRGAADARGLADSISRLAADPFACAVFDDVELFAGEQPEARLFTSIDLIGAFRPLVAEGALRAIFLTTTKAYDQIFAHDPVFSRDAARVSLGELKADEVAEALALHAPELSDHHGVTVCPEAIRQACRHASDRAWRLRPPSSAYRLLDEACVLARAERAPAVTPDHVTATVRRRSLHMTAQKERLADLERLLSERVKGQDEAIRRVAKRLRITKLRLDRRPERPDGVFLFLGPSGVGKTELARTLALVLHGDLSRLVRIDMSEFMHDHEVSKLVGSPPGYVGHGEEGALTGAVARLGDPVILLDEIEKAHPKVLHLFLQVFDAGVLTDGRGKTVDFSSSVIVMTSNLGRELSDAREIGFARTDGPVDPRRDAVMPYLKKILPTEFLNRIDEVAFFRALAREDLSVIAERMLDEETRRWESLGKRLAVTPAVVDLVLDRGYDPQFGARHLVRNFESLVCEPLAETMYDPAWESVRSILLALDPATGNPVARVEREGEA